MTQIFEGDITLTKGRLQLGWECKGWFRLFSKETGELHREGPWEGTYCGASVHNGMLYHQFLEASVDGQFCGFFGQPAYRFMGVTRAAVSEPVDTGGYLFCGIRLPHTAHVHEVDGGRYDCEGICTCGNSLAECAPEDHR